MDDASLQLLKIYGAGYAAGLLPFIVYVFLQRRLRIPRRRRAWLCAAFALATATPVFFVPGWFAVFLPVSLGYWLAPGLLQWTITHVIPDLPWIHAASALATAAVGFLTGWWSKPAADTGSPNQNRLGGAT